MAYSPDLGYSANNTSSCLTSKDLRALKISGCLSHQGTKFRGRRTSVSLWTDYQAV